jgi:hypothetical protein
MTSATVETDRQQPYALFNPRNFFAGHLDLCRLIPWRRRRVNSDMLYRPIIAAAKLPQPGIGWSVTTITAGGRPANPTVESLCVLSNVCVRF